MLRGAKGLADFSLPHKGGGSCICSLPPCGGGLGWGVRTPCLHCTYPPPQPSPTRGEGVLFLPPPQGGRELYLFPPPQGGRELYLFPPPLWGGVRGGGG